MPVKQLRITPIYLQSSAQISLPNLVCKDRWHLQQTYRHLNIKQLNILKLHINGICRILIAALLLPQLDHKALAQRGIASVMVVRGLRKVRRHQNERIISYHLTGFVSTQTQKEEIVEDYVLITIASQSLVRCEKKLRKPPSVRKVQCLGAICFNRSRQVNHRLISSIFLDSQA